MCALVWLSMESVLTYISIVIWTFTSLFQFFFFLYLQNMDIYISFYNPSFLLLILFHRYIHAEISASTDWKEIFQILKINHIWKSCKCGVKTLNIALIFLFFFIFLFFNEEVNFSHSTTETNLQSRPAQKTS
jgi:hypothetical protein